MAFCAFDDSAALFDSTPVENMFITEYMLRAPGDFVKVYLYALMLCYHPSPRMSLSAMAKDLDMQEEDVERAFKYWARDGLVRQVGDNPVCFTLANLKQLTLTRAENPGDKLYNEKFIREAERILKRTLLPEETNLINDWVQVFELPEEVVLMLLQIEMENSRGRVSIKIADRRAKEWAQSGIRTVDDFRDQWIDFPEFLSYLPTLRSQSYDSVLATAAVQEMRDSHAHYYFQIDAVLREGEPIPLERLRGTIRRILFNQRKGEIIRAHEEELCARAAEMGEVKIFADEKPKKDE